jgi:hypothetical protein
MMPKRVLRPGGQVDSNHDHSKDGRRLCQSPGVGHAERLQQ